ncbi:MAG: HigA family addiction module antitoxin [Polyangiaceae bacterium]
MKNRMRPIHPGEVLQEEFLRELDMSANAFAQAIGVPANRVSGIIAGERSVTADTARRFAAALETTPQFWLNLQSAYELRLEELEHPAGDIAKIKSVLRRRAS